MLKVSEELASYLSGVLSAFLIIVGLLLRQLLGLAHFTWGPLTKQCSGRTYAHMRESYAWSPSSGESVILSCIPLIFLSQDTNEINVLK